MGGKKFTDNLGKVYALYTLGFLGFFALMAVLEQMGAGARTIGILFLVFTICIYAVIGWLSRTMQIDAYYVAGREVPALYNGMATAADWMSGVSFVALAGGIYFGGYPYLGFIVGWTGGYWIKSDAGIPLGIPERSAWCESAPCAPASASQSPRRIAVVLRRWSGIATRRRSTSGELASSC